VGIPDNILLKQGKLTPEEFAVMKTHTTLGGKILAGGESDLVKLAAIIAQSHHERWDGSGYPAGTAGDVIPLSGRIVAVADVFDALTHVRPYKEAMSQLEALGLIKEGSGSQFDPEVVEAFLGII
jgi:putative two-component system response regulator